MVAYPPASRITERGTASRPVSPATVQPGEETADSRPGVYPGDDQRRDGQHGGLGGDEDIQADQVPAAVDDAEPHAVDEHQDQQDGRG